MHLHSSASRSNDEWYSASFGCPESFADPIVQYDTCKRRGMSLVTLTDHDTIAGGLQLVDRPDFFLSEEVTTYFPEDGAAIHVLAWNITPAQHDRLQLARASVYDLVDVLRRERIVHACAHPLFSPNGRLSVELLERCVVLFPLLEGVNGLTDRRLEQPLRDVLAGLDATALDALAARHSIARAGWPRNVMTAGSDSHTTRHCATCCTSMPAELPVAAFLDAVAAGAATCEGEQASIDTMHLTASTVTYGFLSARTAERADYRDPFIDLFDVISGRERGESAPAGTRDELVRSLLAGAARQNVSLTKDLAHEDTADAAVMDAIRAVHDGLVGGALDELVDSINDLDMYRLLGAIRDVGGAVAIAVPFLFAARHFGRQYAAANDVLARWTASPCPERPKRIAVFSDTIDQINGVTTSIRRFVRYARANGNEVRVPYCGAAPSTDATLDDAYSNIPGSTTRALELYDGMNFHVPSLLGTIDWLWRERITHVELATPGPMGLAGLVAARLLGLPVTASYHTELPELSRVLSSSALLHSAARHVVGWFYRQVDRVFVFSALSGARLKELGVPAAKITQLAVGIDPDDFSPSFNCPYVYPSLGVRNGPIVLVVSRLSREKNLPMVIDAIDRLQTMAEPPVLVIAGDGPEHDALRASCTKRPWVVFVGAQSGPVLRRLYASADAFVFASMIDTLGLVTMEAMASGVPVLVPHNTAITELVAHGITGYCYEATAPELARMLQQVLEAPERGVVARNAREAMVARWAHVQRVDLWSTIARQPPKIWASSNAGVSSS